MQYQGVDTTVFKQQPLRLVTGLVLAVGLVLPTAPAFALHSDEKSEIENLKKRIETLEARQVPAAAAPAEPGVLGSLGEFVTLHGLLEVEATLAKPEGGDEASDLTLATAQLSLETRLNDRVGGHLILLFEEVEGEDDDLTVDEAVLSLSAPRPLLGQRAALQLGRMYLPFGRFASAMISDPLTLELGETRNTAALVALEGELWTLSAGVFNGATDTAGDNNSIDSWVASLEVTPRENLAFGASYLSDLAESDIELVQDATLYGSSVDAASAFLSAQCGTFGFTAEYLAALDRFDAPLVAAGADLTGRRPSAWSLELDWQPLERLQLATRYEQAHDFQDDLRRYGATASYGLYEHVVVGLEYLCADAKLAEDDPVHQVTAQLALEF